MINRPGFTFFKPLAILPPIGRVTAYQMLDAEAKAHGTTLSQVYQTVQTDILDILELVNPELASEWEEFSSDTTPGTYAQDVPGHVVTRALRHEEPAPEE